MHQKRWLHSDNFTKKPISLSFWLCCLRLPFSFKIRDYYVIVYNASFPQGQVNSYVQNTECFFLKSLWKTSMILRLNCQNKGKQAGVFGFLQTPQRHHLQQSRRWFAGNHSCACDKMSVVIVSPAPNMHTLHFAARWQSTHLFIVLQTLLTSIPADVISSWEKINKNGEIEMVVGNKLMHKVFRLRCCAFKILVSAFHFFFFRLLLMIMNLPI